MKITQEKLQIIICHHEHQVPRLKKTPKKNQHEGIQVIG